MTMGFVVHFPFWVSAILNIILHVVFWTVIILAGLLLAGFVYWAPGYLLKSVGIARCIFLPLIADRNLHACNDTYYLGRGDDSVCSLCMEAGTGPNAAGIYGSAAATTST
jgi:hypothetical protein